MPNPTEQQWAPRGNTRAQFNDNRRGPRRREDRSYPRRRRYDDHRQKERRRPSRDQGLQEKMVNTVRTRDTPQPRLEERRQMVSTQTMTEDEPPPPVPEVRNYKQTIMVEVPREQRRGQRSRESTSGIREPQQGEPTLQTIDEDPGEATTNQEGPFVPPVVMTPRYQGTPSQSDLSSEEELSGEEGDLDSLFPQPHHQWDHQYRPN
ncbi:hypothetical protein DPEC_G00377790 [Dallia pectoralis]|nr:hypothetical protein DPEC_G00377790 [Dallia pectoralis]